MKLQIITSSGNVPKAQSLFGKLLLLFVASMFSTFAVGQIQYHSFSPGLEAIEDVAVKIDVNQDGVIDFDVLYNYSSNNYDDIHTFQISCINQSSVAVEDNTVAAFASQIPIDANNAWSDTSTVIIQKYKLGYSNDSIGNWTYVEHGFVGLRLRVEDQYYYGWLRINFDSFFNLFVLDYAWNSQANQPILSGEELPNQATGLSAKDAGDNFTTNDILASFNYAYNESEFSEYRLILAKDSDDLAFELEAMNEVPADRYLVVPVGADYFRKTIRLTDLTVDREGEAIERFINYRLHVLNVSSSGNPQENTLSKPSDIVNLQAYVQAVPEAEVNVIGNNSSDANFYIAFEPQLQDIYTLGYKVFVVPFDEVDNFSQEMAMDLTDEYFTWVPKADSIQSLYLDNEQLDVFGNSIQQQQPYMIEILSVPDGINAIQGKLSKAKRRVVLDYENSIWAGIDSVENINTFICDTAFSEYPYFTGNGVTQAAAEQEIDLNLDGTADFHLSGVNDNSYSGNTFYLKITPLRNNEVLLCDHTDHDNWAEVLKNGDVFGNLYHWSNEESILRDYGAYWFSDTYFSFGHYPGNTMEEYFIAFRIMDESEPQYAWLRMNELLFVDYGFTDLKNGISGSINLPMIKLYPNPSSDNIQITSGNLDFSNTKVLVYNVLGQQIDHFSLVSNSYTYPVSNLEKGMYYLVLVQDGNRTETHKFLVE